MPLTAETYLELERAAEVRHEYVEGEIVERALCSPLHSLIGANVASALPRRDDWLLFGSEVRVCVHWDKLIAYPDLTGIRGRPQYVDEAHDTLTNPTLLVEVLSPSTRDYDRGAKSYLYRQLPSLAEYLLIEQDTPEVEIYRRLPNNHWEIETVRGLDATVQIERLGWDLPLAEIYRDTERL